MGDTPTPTPTGDNLLTNGDFETWADGLPTNWKTTSSAGNATLTQSTDAHAGSYSVNVAGYASANKRLAYKETKLKAGTYTFSYYAKATTSDKTQTRGGYVPVTDGTVGTYTYNSSYTDITNADWTKVEYTFTLSSATTVSLLVMNVKTSDYATAQDILVDDASLVTSDGGIDEGDTPTPTPTGTFDQDFTAGQGSWTIENVNLGSLTYIWQQSTSYGMKASAYKSGNIAAEADLVSPATTISTATTLTLVNACNYLNSDVFTEHIQCLVSTDNGASWSNVTINSSPDGASWTWATSTVDLSSYVGKTIKVAFKYISTTSCAPTWEIKSVSLK